MRLYSSNDGCENREFPALMSQHCLFSIIICSGTRCGVVALFPCKRNLLATRHKMAWYYARIIVMHLMPTIFIFSPTECVPFPLFIITLHSWDWRSGMESEESVLLSRTALAETHYCQGIGKKSVGQHEIPTTHIPE